MKQYRVQEGERLDRIVFKVYGSVDAKVIEMVMDANKHLLTATILKSGDVINLPEIEMVQAEITENTTTSKALW